VARILIVGSVNIDRVWWLDAPLRAGARLSYDRIERRYGGGGYYTGLTLAVLGHDVRLLTRLAGDDDGRRCLAMLEQAGLDTSLVTMVDGKTTPLEILLDPSGERTIIFPSRARRPLISAIPETDADLAYINAHRVDPAASEALLTRHPVVSQFPLGAGERRPAHVLIASRSDIALDASATLFAAARARAGVSLCSLVLTDGANPVRVVGEAGEMRLPVPFCPPVAETIGAGDVFAGGFIDAYVRGASEAEAARRGSETAVRFLADRVSLLGAVGLPE
jgi:sugar/nucleoside kinase (ribokinase family)